MTKIEKVIPLQVNKTEKYSLKTMDELAEAGKSMPKRKRLFGDYIFERELIHFPSERGTGKTFILLQLCIAVAKCFDSFLGERIERYGNTLFLSFEMSEEDITERVHDLYQHPPEGIHNDRFHEADVLTSKEEYRSLEHKVINIIEAKRPVLVVLDNFSIAFTDIDKRSDTAKAWRELLKLKDKYRFALIIVDHTRKNTRHLRTDSDLQSGTGVKSDLSDGDMFIRFSCQDHNYRLLKRAKTRRRARYDGAKLIAFNPETLWFKHVADNVNEMDHLNPEIAGIMEEDHKLEMAKTLLSAGHSYETVASTVGIPKSTLHRKMNKAKS